MLKPELSPSGREAQKRAMLASITAKEADLDEATVHFEEGMAEISERMIDKEDLPGLDLQ